VTALRETLPGRLLLQARERPDAVVLREKRLGLWRELTWRDYRDQVRAAARMLAGLGVGPGDHVAILSDNRTEWLFAELAAQTLGARSVGIYQTNPPAEVAYILNDSGSVVLFCEDQEQVDKAVAIVAETPTVRHVVVFEPRGTRQLGDPRLEPWTDFLARGNALLAAGPADWFEERVAALEPTAPAMVVYTSGTTGHPKGAMLSSRNVLEVTATFNATLGVGPSDSLLSYLPLCHVAEKVLSVILPLTTGAIVHFGEAMETVQADLREVSPTIFLGVPRIWEKMHATTTVKMQDASWLKRTLFRRFAGASAATAARRRAGKATLADRLRRALADLLVFAPLRERLGLRRCRLALAGAAPISPDLIAWYHGVGVEIVEGYGQTECAGLSHLNLPGHNRIGTVGKSVPLVEHRLADDGEVLVRGPNVFCGYLHRPEATAETIDADGWLHTGDIGTIDADGYLSITGRKRDIIITSGGKNLSPEKLENALKTSPYIKEAVAVGDRRKFVGALIQIEYDNVGNWATRRGLPYTSYADLAAKPEVVRLVGDAIDTANELLAPVEQIKGFRILPKELSQDDGELTATQKVRRRAVTTAFAALIDTIYRDVRDGRGGAA
jgi:long-chain acyl-CoA synthetase